MARTANAAATVPEPCQIIGTALAPFCLGHHLLFKRLGLPFADAPMAPATRDEVILSIALCGGASYERTLAAHLDGSWEGTFDRWTENVKGPWYRHRRVDWEKSEALFRAYLADGYELPPIWRDKGTSAGSIKLSAPWEQILKCKLVGAGFTESEVLNGYLPAKWYDFYTIKEAQTFSELSIARTTAYFIHSKSNAINWKNVFYTEQDDALVRMGVNYSGGEHV